MLNMKKLITKLILGDFVVEKGISGIWSYRKWNSGLAECWGTHSGNYAVNTSSPAYGGYRSANISLPAFPFSFTEIPTMTATCTGGSSAGAYVNHVEPSTTGGSFFFGCGASLTASTRSAAFHVVGYWK